MIINVLMKSFIIWNQV